MFEREFNDIDPDDTYLDWLVEFLRSLPTPAMRIAVPKRFREMICAKQLLEVAFDTNKVEAEFHSPGSSGSLRLECETLAVLDISAFMQAVHLGDNFEIYPLTNGKVRFAMMFYGLFRAVPC